MDALILIVLTFGTVAVNPAHINLIASNLCRKICVFKKRLLLLTSFLDVNSVNRNVTYYVKPYHKKQFS